MVQKSSYTYQVVILFTLQISSLLSPIFAQDLTPNINIPNINDLPPDLQTLILKERAVSDTNILYNVYNRYPKLRNAINRDPVLKATYEGGRRIACQIQTIKGIVTSLIKGPYTRQLDMLYNQNLKELIQQVYIHINPLLPRIEKEQLEQIRYNLSTPLFNDLRQLVDYMINLSTSLKKNNDTEVLDMISEIPRILGRNISSDSIGKFDQLSGYIYDSISQKLIMADIFENLAANSNIPTIAVLNRIRDYVVTNLAMAEHCDWIMRALKELASRRDMDEETITYFRENETEWRQYNGDSGMVEDALKANPRFPKIRHVKSLPE